MYEAKLASYENMFLCSKPSKFHTKRGSKLETWFQTKDS